MHAALIKGRHYMPTEKYIYEVIDDVKDYRAMEVGARGWLIENIGISTELGRPINTASYTDDAVYVGKERLYLYVTGLSAALAAVIKACAELGVSLTLLHYDRETGEYTKQHVF